MGLSTLAWVALDDANACVVTPLTFSQTQAGTEELRASLREYPPVAPFDALSDRLHAPPSDRQQLCEELSELHELALHRPERLPQILCERDLACFSFGSFVIGEPETRRRHPVTLRLISNALELLTPVIQSAKLRHDRVRPSMIDSTLTTAIAVPDHPAYPSGHAAQAMLIAEILSTLDSARRSAFLSDAERIAANREIAGLHYRSDSLAGFELARAFVRQAQLEPWFVGLLSYASEEWQAPAF